MADLDSDGDGTPDRPDSTTAAQAARKVGTRVEDLAQRTPTTQVFANADGTWTTEMSGGPVRAQDPSTGKWSPIDTALDKAGSRWQPASALGEVSFSSGGDGPLVAMRNVDGRDLSWSWPDPLPAPEVDGSTLTYPDVVPHGDLVVKALPGGFSHSVVLRQAPDGPLSLPMLVDTDGANLSEAKDGSLSIKVRRQELVSAPQPMMWDATSDLADPESIGQVASGQAEAVPVDVAVDTVGDQTRVELAPDAAYLSDPDTEYPVTIDPSYSISVSAAISLNSPSLPFLMAGGVTGGANPYRSAVAFDGSSVFSAGEHIDSAELSLYGFSSTDCNPQSMKVQRVTSSWGTGTTWATQPSVTTAGESVAMQTPKGGPTCTAGGWDAWDITDIVQAWADGAPRYGIRVGAADETVARTRYYESIGGQTLGDPTKAPKLTITGSAVALSGAAPVPSDSRYWMGDVFVRTQTPSWTTSAIDPDGGEVRYEIEVHDGTGPGSEEVASCATGYVASGTESSCTPTTPLSNGTYYARAAADDGTATGAWSPWRKVTVNYDQPEPATVSCPGTSDQTWYVTRPATTTTCTFTSPGSAQLEWSLNGKAQMPLSADGSGAGVTWAISIPTSGWTNLKVRGLSDSGLASDWTEHSYGTGNGQLISPVAGATSATTIPLQAVAASGVDSVTFQWRIGNTAAWTNATQVFTASGQPYTNTLDDTGAMSSTPVLTWRPTAEPGMTIPSYVYVRAQFVDGATTYNTGTTTVTVAAHAAGKAAPTAQVGPGVVQLGTGEFETDAPDVSVGGMGVVRTHLSNAELATGAAGVFGPGWGASLGSGGPAGLAVTDQRATNGSLLFTTPNGIVFTYRSSNPAASNLTGAFAATGDAISLGATVSINSSTGTLSYTEAGGTVTTFEKSAGGWLPASTTGTGAESTISYYYGADGLPTWIVAPAPAGVTCTPTALVAGCQALQVAYATVGSAKRVASIDYHAWDPKLNDSDGDHGDDGLPNAEAAMSSTTVAKYGYNSDGTLQAFWDPRVADGASAQKTTYTYATAGTKTRLSSITPPGLKSWQINYDADGAVSTVTREQDAAIGTGNATWTVKYGLKLNAEGDGLPNLSAAKTAAWGQPAADAPDTGAAVFGPSKVPAATPTATDWTFATLYYWNAAGRLTNTANSSSGWQVNSARYDEGGNKIWTLTPLAKARAITDGSGNAANSAAAADRYATWALYNADGSRVEAVYGPTIAAVTKDGTARQARSLTQYVYDDEADASLVPARPATSVPGGFGMVAEVRASATDEATPGVWAIGQNTPPSSAIHLYDTVKTRYRYDAVKAGDPSGWTLRQPTAVLAQNGSSWDKTIYRYDAAGRLIEERSPQGVASNQQTRWHDTVYYTANAAASLDQCDNKPEWAGLVCWEGPAAQPSTGKPIPTTSYTGYSLGQAVTRSVVNGGSATKTGISRYDDAGRQVGASTSTSGTSDQSVGATTTAYSGTTGLPVTVSDGNMTMTTAYDTWGRVTSQSDGAGNTATTSYNAASQVASVNDGKGTYAYTYGDRRGLATSVNTGIAGTTVGGSFDANGNLYLQRVVNAGGAEVDDFLSFDVASNLVGRATLSVVGGTSAYWSDSDSVDVWGKVRTSSEVGGRQETFTYDDRGRLAQVVDQKTATGAADCYTRKYTLTADSNRTGLATYNATAGGACQNTTATTKTSTYDDADRITNAGYAYDDLGRTTALPGVDTTNPAAGDLTAAYYSNDMVASVTQGSRGQTYMLDPLGRVSTTKNLIDGVSLVETTNHYADSSDSPAWTETKSRPDAATAWTVKWERHVRGLDGKLALTQASTGNPQVATYNTHGDLTRTVDLSSGTLSAYTSYTEFGATRDGATSTNRYGWLGVHQRDSQGTGGLILMGVRRYNPVTGRFLSPDPVRGGNDNSYTYPLDPCNQSDLTGLACDSRLKDWLPIYASDIKWYKWTKTDEISGPSGYIRDQLEEMYGLVPARFKVVDKNIRKGVRDVTQRRCYKGSWQYRDGLIYLAQFRWKVTVVFLWVQVPGGVWINGASTVTDSTYYKPRPKP